MDTVEHESQVLFVACHFRVCTEISDLHLQVFASLPQGSDHSLKPLLVVVVSVDLRLELSDVVFVLFNF